MPTPADGKWRKPACALFLLAWFVYFGWDSLKVRFAPDDMMNMAYYFRAGPWRLLGAQFAPWTGFYRPMGGWFYMSLFHWFGFNPLPYHFAILLVLGANVWLTYRFARVLGCEELAAGLAALVFCYHPGLSNLYYNSAFVYDVLCFFFYVGALVYYARIRNTGRRLGRGETAVFLALFLGALNAKEMGASLPVALLAYEWFYHRLKGAGWTLLFAAALDLVSLWGKVFGPEALIGQPGYGPVISWRRLLDFQGLMLSDVFLNWHYAVWPIWVLLAYLAWRRNRPELRFCWVFAVAIAPLPIEFLQGRSGACLAIPAAGLAVLVSVVVVDLANAVSQFLAGEPAFRALGRKALLAAAIAAGVFLWGHRIQYLKARFVKPTMTELGQSAWNVIQQFRALDPHVRPGSQVVFLHDPSKDLETAFIAELWFRDRSVSIHLQRLNPLPPEELAGMDYVFDFVDGRLVRVK